MNNEKNLRVFIDYFSPKCPGDSVAVKDIIDIKGSVTSAGSRYIFENQEPAEEDATCLVPLRQAGVELAGKTNLAEIAFGVTGENEWIGSPINPLGEDLIPGGSSSGSAVAVALKMCKFALGTDTGGSIRIPSACCGIAGLKPTFGVVSTTGVRPLAPSMDVVGPIANDIEGLKSAFSLLVPHWPAGQSELLPVNRLSVDGVAREVDLAIDYALDAAGIKASPCPLSNLEWSEMVSAGDDILWSEAADANRYLLAHWSELENESKLNRANQINADKCRLRTAGKRRNLWSARIRKVIAEYGIILTPTIECLPPTYKQVREQKFKLARFTIPVNLTGLPSVVVPIPTESNLPSSLQLIGPEYSEMMLLDLASLIESSVR